jgi:lipopolysaccharide/colanic/teichoic acid biosynthesis glycosyltransferase
MYKLFFKRFIDIVCGLLGCIIFAVAFIFVAPIIHFTDKGPVFYNAERRGKNGKTFKMYKFRSMYVNSPNLKNADGSTYNSDDDPRVTKIGKIMRKTSVDELPQFINVLKGDMSMIGPRPTLATKPFSECDPETIKRYDVRPGITGYSQAYFRNSITQQEKFKYDCYYAENVSFVMDVKILFKTAMSVLKRENINTVTAEKEKAEISK